ncbi:lens fiber membrane intrinsic protein-like [Ptychodera flava]|uniref:lens fiber membrane intrinsic protein-like n=1 Tax=Ptychodera flava TaxID=63121 RepID=UPI00396A5AFE
MGSPADFATLLLQVQTISRIKMAGAKVVIGVSLFVVAYVLIAVSTETDFWTILGPIGGTTFSTGLWRICVYRYGEKECEGLLVGDLRAFVYGARACMVSACILAFIALVCSVLMFIAERTKLRMVAVGIMYVSTGLLVLVGTTWFAVGYTEEVQQAGGDFAFGYSIIVGWVSVALAKVSGLLIVYQAYYGNQDRYAALP